VSDNISRPARALLRAVDGLRFAPVSSRRWLVGPAKLDSVSR
jgi:hypothetical protein